MQTNDQIIRVEQPIGNSPTSSPNTGENSSTISVYSGELSPLKVVELMIKLKAAFPQLPPDFYDVLNDRIQANGFSDERLKDAIHNVIDTCVYPTPTVANIISFDRRVKLFTYNDMLDMNDRNRGGAFKWHKRLKCGKYASIEDIEQYKLE